MLKSVKEIVRKGRFEGKFVECPVKKTLCLAEECFNCKHIDDASTIYSRVKCVVVVKNNFGDVIRSTSYNLPLLDHDKI